MHVRIILFVLLISAAGPGCKKEERGAPDCETISRKLFDTMRNNDFEKSELLMPDKGTFRKVSELKGVMLEDVEQAYDAYTQNALSTFDAAHSFLQDWTNTKYLRSTIETAKVDELTTAAITCKFDAAGKPCKFVCHATKYNSRWYYDGDIVWVAKAE
ncbi:MAG: hypothetical protein R2794_12420 [Chitinophagales bacterium]